VAHATRLKQAMSPTQPMGAEASIVGCDPCVVAAVSRM
jgi:hypothetical protein